jgi:hypothetical protein
MLSESVDLYAAVAAVCRVLSDDRPFVASVLKLELPDLDAVDGRWKERLGRDATLEMMFETLTREYEWSFRQLQAGATPVVEG